MGMRDQARGNSALFTLLDIGVIFGIFLKFVYGGWPPIYFERVCAGHQEMCRHLGFFGAVGMWRRWTILLYMGDSLLF